MRTRIGHIRAIAVFTLLFTPVFARSAEPPEHRVTGDLAIRARAIIQKHCSACHTGNPEPGFSKLKLMDRKQVVARKKPVPLVTAKGRSQLLELVKDGSMPPGNRPGLDAEEIAVLEKWVNAEAPAYPITFDERTTLSDIADDFERIVEKTKVGDPAEYIRYVSFAHLIRDGQPIPDLVAAEKALNDALSAAAERPFHAEPVDVAATLFRVETSRLGWLTRELFNKMEVRDKDKGGKRIIGGAYRFQPFDLLLMEYPHARVLPANDPDELRLEKLLARENQFRPVPFVRGDWLADALLGDGFFSRLMGNKKLTPLAEDIKSLAALEKALARKGEEPDGPIASPFVGAKPVIVPAPLAGRASIPPLAGWYTGDVTPEKAPFTLKAELVVSGKAVTQVVADQEFQLRVECDRTVQFTLLMILSDGEVRVQPVQGGSVLKERTERSLAPLGKTNFVIAGIGTGGDVATEHFVLLASETALPEILIVRSKHPDKWIERFLPDPTAKGFDPNTAVRKVIPIKVTRK